MNQEKQEQEQSDNIEEVQEVTVYPRVKVNLCDIHSKEDWTKGDYYDNKDGTVSCGACPWGCRLPGYMRVVKGKIVDLRFLN